VYLVSSIFKIQYFMRKGDSDDFCDDDDGDDADER
jgi:hypothetical protein